LFELYRDEILTEKPAELSLRGGAYYSEVAVSLMESIWQNRRDVHVVNVQNHGVVPFLDESAVIETNCLVDSQGAHPVHFPRQISPSIRGLIQVVKSCEDLTIGASIQGDYHLALQALAVHPLVPSVGVARAILDDILLQEGQWLPRF